MSRDLTDESYGNETFLESGHSYSLELFAKASRADEGETLCHPGDGDPNGRLCYVLTEC